MKPKLILVSHGNLSVQMHESAKMIVGDIEGLYTIAMLPDDGLDGTRAKLDAVLAEIGDDAPILILVDLFFGTPCNVSVAAMSGRENIALLTGMNLSMVMEYAVTELEDVDELAEYLLEAGTASMKTVEKPEPMAVDMGEEGYED